MDTVQPVLKGGRDVWDRINMPESEYQERVQNIKAEMQKAGTDVLLIYGSTECYGNPVYVTNSQAKLPLGGTLAGIPLNDEPVLFYGGGSREIPSIGFTTWVKQVRASSQFSVDCVAYLKEKNLFPSTVGLLGFKQLMPYGQFQGVLEALKECRIVDCDQILTGLRSVKSPRECDQIRRASRILNTALSQIARNSLKKLNEKYLESELIRALRLEGAEDYRLLVADPAGENWTLRPAEDALIPPGANRVIYMAASFERYWSEWIRTFKVEDSGLTETRADDAQALFARLTRRMKPGKKVSGFYRESLEELRDSKLDYSLDHGLGEGIGLDLQEFPFINENDDSELEEGMCLTLRLAVSDGEKGGFMIGNTLYLSASGPEILTR